VNPWLLLLLLPLFYVSITLLGQRHRAAAMRGLATRTGFHYLGRGVPKSLNLSGTELENATAIWNLIDGDCHGIRVMVFDCRIGAGKGSWRRTVIATNERPERLSATSFNPGLTVERSGEWSIIYQPKAFSLIPPGLMPVDEVEAHVKAIRN
jgi:hypothetical protein